MAYPGNSGAWWLADKQEGPECGFEAVENAIQHYWPVGNQVSETILKDLAARHGFLYPDGSLDHHGYQTLLNYYRIGSQWTAFDHNVLIEALTQHRIAIAIVDGYRIDRKMYPRKRSGHAILLTNYVLDSNGFVIRYTGFDSNYGAQVRWWAVHGIEEGAEFYVPNSLLITDRPVGKAFRQSPYRADT